eukprot:gene26472-33053_t
MDSAELVDLTLRVKGINPSVSVSCRDDPHQILDASFTTNTFDVTRLLSLRYHLNEGRICCEECTHHKYRSKVASRSQCEAQTEPHPMHKEPYRIHCTECCVRYDLCFHCKGSSLLVPPSVGIESSDILRTDPPGDTETDAGSVKLEEGKQRVVGDPTVQLQTRAKDYSTFESKALTKNSVFWSEEMLANLELAARETRHLPNRTEALTTRVNELCALKDHPLTATQCYTKELSLFRRLDSMCHAALRDREFPASDLAPDSTAPTDSVVGDLSESLASTLRISESPPVSSAISTTPLKGHSKPSLGNPATAGYLRSAMKKSTPGGARSPYRQRFTGVNECKRISPLRDDRAAYEMYLKYDRDDITDRAEKAFKEVLDEKEFAVLTSWPAPPIHRTQTELFVCFHDTLDELRLRSRSAEPVDGSELALVLRLGLLLVDVVGANTEGIEEQAVLHDLVMANMDQGTALRRDRCKVMEAVRYKSMRPQLGRFICLVTGCVSDRPTAIYKQRKTRENLQKTAARKLQQSFEQNLLGDNPLVHEKSHDVFVVADMQQLQDNPAKIHRPALPHFVDVEVFDESMLSGADITWLNAAPQLSTLQQTALRGACELLEDLRGQGVMDERYGEALAEYDGVLGEAKRVAWSALTADLGNASSRWLATERVLHQLSECLVSETCLLAVSTLRSQLAVAAVSDDDRCAAVGEVVFEADQSAQSGGDEADETADRLCDGGEEGSRTPDDHSFCEDDDNDTNEGVFEEEEEEAVPSGRYNLRARTNKSEF